MAEFFKKYFSENFFCDILFIFVLSLVLTFASFLFIDGVVHFSIPFVLLKKPTILFMNFIPVFILMLIMYFAIGSVGWAFLSVGAMIFIMGVANQNKLFYCDDNLRITDIVLLKETLGMVKSGISIKLRWLYLVYPLILIACGRYFLKLDKYRPRALARVLGAILMCFVGPEDKGISDYLDRKSFTGTDEEYNIANNYIYGVKDTADQLLKFTEELEKEKSPVVVIFYGDHLARLGEEGKVYESMGVDIGFDSPEGWLKHYTTPFIIWANSAAKEKIGDDMVGEIPTMSNYYLFSYALEKMGYKTPYIQYLSERRKEYPVDASSYISENGKLTADLSEKTKKDKLFHYMMQYYRLSHFSYDEVANKK